MPTKAWMTVHNGGHFQLGFGLNATIGQGATTVTVLQLALAYAALANGGTLYQPQLVRAVETSNGTVVQESSVAPAPAGEVHATTTHAETPLGFPPFDTSTFASQLLWFAITFAVLNVVGLLVAIATGRWHLKEIYWYAYFPIAGLIWLLGALGRLPRVKPSDGLQEPVSGG